MEGAELILALKKKFGVTTDRALASILGLSDVSIQNWKNRSPATPKQTAGLIQSAMKAAKKDLRTTAIRPLVEFYPIQKCDSKGAQNTNYSVSRMNTHTDMA